MFILLSKDLFVGETGQKIVVVPTFCQTLCQCRGAKKDFGKSPMIPFSKTEWEALTSDVQDV